MSKPTRITATYRPNDGEMLQVSIEIRNDYPDALATARAETVRAMREILADALEQYGRRDAAASND